ncbi:GAP family protein [Luteimonas sp. RD2P54]|uniref:GAP family protein n=1 Tax=Luteimonas endophytica TaxID=3042023 RepID=A0ABT6JA35_9GAMM|nr:GAP family protein [Luteimonas endophytica]MDH5823686.1 GAP family protein [Luteimonas endophytica]
MEAPLLPALLALALLDSLNPSALLVALWLLSRPQAAPRLLAYVAGILVAYLGLGIAMMLGFGALRDALGDALDHPVALAAQALLGAALLAYGIFAPKTAHRAQEPHAPARAHLAGYVVLGMTVTVVELATALPYFAAIALMLAEALGPQRWLPLLFAYNAIFVAPPLALLALHALLGSRADQRFARWRQRLQRGAREAALWIFALVGVALLGDAVSRHLGSNERASAPGVEGGSGRR